MRVLLVQAFLGRKEVGGPVFPIGLAYLTSVLKGHEIRILDLNTFDDPYHELQEGISNFNPDVVGLSLRNVDTTQRNDRFYYFKEIKPTIELIKKIKPRAKIVMGGPGFSMFAREIMERIPEIDIGVYLEGEESFPELLDNLGYPEKVKGLFIRNDSGIHFTGMRDFPNFDELPIPNRNLVDLKLYKGSYMNIGVQTKRGCPLRCVYCSYPLLNGFRLRTRSPKKVVDEIEYLVKEFKVNELMFVDSVFNEPLEHAWQICEEIIKRGLKIEWKAYYNIKGIDEKFVLLAQKAGCVYFMFSPDAMTEKGLKRLRKNFTVKDVQKTFAIARKMSGAKFGFSLFCNYPGQDLLGFIKTMFFFIKGNLLLYGKGEVGLNWIRIEPNTEIYRIAIEENAMSDNTELLPVNEAGLSALFYSPPPLRYLDNLVIIMLSFGKRLFKPL